MHRTIAFAFAVPLLLACTPTARDDRREPPVVFQSAPVREAEPPPPPPEPPPEPAPEPPSEPLRCTPTQLPVGALEYVRDEPLDLPIHISPSGRFGTQTGYAGEGCEVWELDTGTYLGEFADERDFGACVRWPGDVIPCERWPALEDVEMTPVIAGLAPKQFANNEAIAVVAERCAGRGFVGGETRFRFACADGGADEGRNYVGLSLSGDGERFVAARVDALELRGLDDGELIAELSLSRPKPPARDLLALGLAWSARGMPVAVSQRGPVCNHETDDAECEYETWNDDEHAWELRRWDGPKARAQATVLNIGDDAPAPFFVHELAVDPLGLWLFVTADRGDGHDIPWGRAQLPLTPEAAARSFDVSGEWGDGEDVYTYFDTDTGPWSPIHGASAEGEWLVGARTVRVWTITSSEYDGEGNGSDDLYWASFELTPTHTRRSGPHELASDYNVESHALDLLGVADGRGVVAWSHCFDSDDPTGLGDYDDIGPDNCRGASPVPADCEARGTSDALDWLLLACKSGWRLQPLGPAAEALTDVQLSAPADGPITAVFGRSGLAVASERRGTRLLQPNGEPRATLEQVHELLPVVLDAELDRAVGRRGEALVILDLAGARQLAQIPASALTHPVELLAFSPDAARLAVSDGRHISLITVETGTVERSWDAGAVLGMAWRQDGAVLLTGTTRALPERAWDPARGVLATTQPDPAFIERLALADLDPSWRWAFDGDDLLLRVVDGLTLVLEGDSEITQTGLYDSGVPESLNVRVGGLPSSRVVTLAQLPARLHVHGLLEAFVLGAALPAPRLSEAELAALTAATIQDD